MTKKEADFVVGGVAQGYDYQFRLGYEEEIWESLRTDNVLLLAPRRTGKTSLMYKMLGNPQDDFLVVHLNVEECDSPEEFYLMLMDAINEHQPTFAKQLVKGWQALNVFAGKIDEVEISGFKVKLRTALDWQQNWREIGDQLIEQVAKTGYRVLFIVDELPDMVSEMIRSEHKELRKFLHHFRKIRTAHSSSNNLRWLLTGSVNLRGVLTEAKLIKEINDLKIEELPEISAEELNNFVVSMLDDRGVSISEQGLARLTYLLGAPIPFFVQLFTQELYRYAKRNKLDALERDDVETVFEKALMGEAAQDKLQHYHGRIREHYPLSQQPAIYEMLATLSSTEDGMSKASLYAIFRNHLPDELSGQDELEIKIRFESLMMRLGSDFYIREVIAMT